MKHLLLAALLAVAGIASAGEPEERPLYSVPVLGDIHYDRADCHDMGWVNAEMSRDLRQIRNYIKVTETSTPELFRQVEANAANPVIDLMADQKTTTVKGGTMRLGAYKCQLDEDSLAYRIYGRPLISERHRHRYELNNDYVERLNAAGMRTSGRNPETGLVEIVEIPSHPFFIGVQFHPEYKSTPENPQPIFVAFVKAAMEYHDKK